MHRPLCLLLLMLSASSGAAAYDPESAAAELTNVGGLRGLSLGVFGENASPGLRPVAGSQLQTKTAGLEASWSGGGFLIALSVGRTSYTELTLSSLTEGSDNFTGIRFEQEVRSVLGGTLAAGFSAYQYGFDSESFRELNFSLRWTRRF